MSNLEFRVGPTEIQLKGVYGQVWVSLEPRFATIESQTSPIDSQTSTLVEGGPFICYSGEGVASGDQPNERSTIRKSTIGEIASVKFPKDVIPIVKATGELGILTVRVTEHDDFRVSADRWQEWQIEQVRWAAFVEVFKADAKIEPDVALVKQRLVELGRSIDTVQIQNVDLPNPSILISELLHEETVQEMLEILVNHFNVLSQFAFHLDHLEMRLARMGLHYGWTILSKTSFGAAILSAAVCLGSKGNSLTICPQCSEIFPPRRSNQTFCSVDCRSRFNSNGSYQRRKAQKKSKKTNKTDE